MLRRWHVRSFSRCVAATALCGALLTPGGLWAQAAEQESKETQKKETRTVTVRVAGSQYWIGVHAVPVDDALKTHLGLKNGLIVQRVLPDSPSSKAGLQSYDVLLKFGGKEVSDIEDLVKSVEETGKKEIKVLILREGKEQTVTVVPADRPAEDQLHRLVPQFDSEELRVRIAEAMKNAQTNDGTILWRALGPAVVGGQGHAIHLQAHAAAEAFPNGLSVSVSKENDQPAKITAKMDGKTYETTEEKLEELPAQIRGPVERMLKGGKGLTLGFLPDGKNVHRYEVRALSEDARKQAETIRQQVAESLKKAHAEAEKAEAAGEAAKEAVRQRVEVRRIEGGALDELRKEIQSLRKEIESLKETKKDDDK